MPDQPIPLGKRQSGQLVELSKEGEAFPLGASLPVHLLEDRCHFLPVLHAEIAPQGHTKMVHPVFSPTLFAELLAALAFTPDNQHQSLGNQNCV